MAEITAATVKELRERTGAGMMDCKKALGETQGDMEAAIDWLRTKGLAAAAKKAGRTAAEGLVGVAVEGNRGAVVEVNSETDFVAKNEQFQEFVRTVAELALTGQRHRRGPARGRNGRAAAPSRRSSPPTSRRSARISRSGAPPCFRSPNGVVVSYVHNAVTPGLGKIGVLVALESEGDKAAL